MKVVTCMGLIYLLSFIADLVFCFPSCYLCTPITIVDWPSLHIARFFSLHIYFCWHIFGKLYLSINNKGNRLLCKMDKQRLKGRLKEKLYMLQLNYQVAIVHSVKQYHKPRPNSSRTVATTIHNNHPLALFCFW